MRRGILVMRHSSLLQDLLDIGTTLSLVDGPEQDVHVLQTAALRFLDEEQHEHSHGQAEDAKHEKGSPSDVVDRAGGDFRDDEVEEPLRSRSGADTVRSEAGRKDLDDCFHLAQMESGVPERENI
jgi:hypothetical protein